MRRLASIATLAMLLVGSNAFAEGFATPVIDGVIDAAYGAAEASDPAGDHWQGLNNMDLTNLYVVNDNNFWYFALEVNDNLSTTQWGKYIIDIDVTNDGNGATTDAWGRSVSVADPHKPEYSLRSWTDNVPYGPEDSQLQVWGGASWSSPGGLDDAALGAGATSVLEWKISRTSLGDPANIWVGAWTTGGGGSDNAQDTSNDPAGDWDATDWSTPAVLSVSTAVARQAGGDTTPPTVTGYSYDGHDRLIYHYSEPVDTLTAENISNYAVTGGVSVAGATLTDASTVELTLSATPTLGICIDATATGVKDLAGNTIVNNGLTNVASFYLTELNIRGHMSIHLQAHSFFPVVDTFAIEGGISPLTWNPTCDDLFTSTGVDSVYATTLLFATDCDVATDEPDTVTLGYKFTHQCTEWETVDNHSYELNMGLGRDTVNIWWDNQAPVDFTDKDIDVIFFVANSGNGGISGDFGANNELGVGGDVAPLSWTLPPVAPGAMSDGGTLPDSAAGDGIFTTRVTFPSGSLKDVEYKYVHSAVGDTLWTFECDLEPNRTLFLNDSLFSSVVPIVMDLQWFDICGSFVDVDLGTAPASSRLHQNAPNPFNPTTSISFALANPGHVDLSVYDMSGRLVKTLVNRELPAGNYTGGHAIIWSGSDDSGRSVGSGVYFYKLETAGFTETKKMVLVR